MPAIVPPPPAWLQRAKFVSKADAAFLYNEIHVQRAYEQMGVKIILQKKSDGGGGGAVLDIGANIGMFTTRAAEALGPYGTVIAGEPLPATFEALHHNVASHRDWCDSENIPCAPVITVNAGFGDGSSRSSTFAFFPQAAGWSTLASFESPESVLRDMAVFIDTALDNPDSDVLNPIQRALGSTLRRVSPQLYRYIAKRNVEQLMAGKELIECRMCTVSEIIEENKLERVVLLKIDVERAEVGVLRGVLPQHWPLIEQVAVEVHEENLAEVVSILDPGFRFVHTMQTEDLRKTSIFMVFAHNNRE